MVTDNELVLSLCIAKGRSWHNFNTDVGRSTSIQVQEWRELMNKELRFRPEDGRSKLRYMDGCTCPYIVEGTVHGPRKVANEKRQERNYTMCGSQWKREQIIRKLWKAVCAAAQSRSIGSRVEDNCWTNQGLPSLGWCYRIRALARYPLHLPFPRQPTLSLHQRIPCLLWPMSGSIHIRPVCWNPVLLLDASSQFHLFYLWSASLFHWPFGLLVSISYLICFPL